MAGPNLPTNIDSTYADSATDPSQKLHQQHTDIVHGIVNQFDTSIGTASAGNVLAWNGSVYAPAPAVGNDLSIWVDSFTGTDDQKLTAAIAAQQADPRMSPMVLSARTYNFNQTRTIYSGLKLVGSRPIGVQNLEIGGGANVPTRIVLGSSITSGTSSWWVSPGSDTNDIYMAYFSVQGNSGSSVHQFIDYNTGSMYPAYFDSLSFNFMRGVFGLKTRPCFITQCTFAGHWTVNNLWDTQFTLGGSDNSLWMGGGLLNIGPSGAGVQTGTYADNDYEIIFSSIAKTDVGFIYVNCRNGWRGIKVTGSLSMLNFFGGVYEGLNADTSSATAGSAPGTVIRLEGGTGNFFGVEAGQGMANPDAAESGLIHMTAGEWSFHGPQFYRGGTAESVPMIYHSGGRLTVIGAKKRMSETWTGRPVLSTGGTSGGTSGYSYYCPDGSMTVV